jgi:hypothetical protein
MRERNNQYLFTCMAIGIVLGTFVLCSISPVMAGGKATVNHFSLKKFLGTGPSPVPVNISFPLAEAGTFSVPDMPGPKFSVPVTDSQDLSGFPQINPLMDDNETAVFANVTSSGSARPFEELSPSGSLFLFEDVSPSGSLFEFEDVSPTGSSLSWDDISPSGSLLPLDT